MYGRAGLQLVKVWKPSVPSSAKSAMALKNTTVVASLASTMVRSEDSAA